MLHYRIHGLFTPGFLSLEVFSKLVFHSRAAMKHSVPVIFEIKLPQEFQNNLTLTI